MEVQVCLLQHVKDVKTLSESELGDEEDQAKITTAKISNNETYKIYDKGSWSTTTSDTLVNEENSQSSHNNSQNIPNVVTSISDNTDDDISNSTYPIKTYINLPKINYEKVYMSPELNTHEKVVIISQAGKANGKNKYWYNIKSIYTGNFMSVDFSKVNDWDYLEKVLINNITESDNIIEILTAKRNEFENWKDHKAFEEVENEQ